MKHAVALVRFLVIVAILVGLVGSLATSVAAQNPPVDADGDGFDAAADCDDANPATYPGAPELADGLDNNCDGQLDEGLPVDTDGDGLFDGDETDVYGTNPTLADTDGDGVGDGDEVAQSSDPLDPNSPAALDDTSPDVALTVVPSGPIAGIFLLSATATDAESGIASVVFKNAAPDADWTDIGTAMPTVANAYELLWNTTTAVDGEHVVLAVATDHAGNERWSEGVLVTLDNTPPTGELTGPADGSTIMGSIIVAADASDDVSGIATVLFQFSGDGGVTWTDIATISAAPYETTWNPTGLASSDYLLRAVMTDAVDNQYSSATHAVTYAAPPNTPPDAVDDTATTRAGRTVGIYILGNDADAETAADQLGVQVSDPPHGSATYNADSHIYYTPDNGFVGTDTFTYTLSDESASDTATVTVEVLASGDLALTAVDDLGDPIVDVCFTIYAALPGGGAGDYVDSGCDGSDEQRDGQTVVRELLVGRYVAEGYGSGGHQVASAGPLDVTVGRTTYPIVLRPPAGMGALTIVAVDGAGTRLPGGCWIVRDQNNPDPNVSWHSCDFGDNVFDGTIRIGPLAPGTYTIDPHTATAGGYLPVAARVVSVAADQTTRASIAHTAGAGLAVRMLREDGTTPVPGPCFWIYGDAPEGTLGDAEPLNFVCDSFDGASDGALVTRALPPGNYVLHTSGYSPLDNSHPFVVTADGRAVTPADDSPLVVTYGATGTAHFRVVHEDGRPFSDHLCFQTFQDIGDGVRGENQGGTTCPGLTTWPDGTRELGDLSFGGLTSGDYLLALAPPFNGYALSADVPFSVDDDQTPEYTVTVGLRETGPAADFSLRAIDELGRTITRARIGQTIQLFYMLDNTGTESLTSVAASDTLSSELQPLVELGTSWGRHSWFPTYTVTAADAAAGTLTVTATVTTDQLGSLSRTLAIEVVAAPNTPTGPDVLVEAAGGTGATLTFTGITAPGFTAVIPIDPPAGLPLPGSFQAGAAFYEIDTTAAFTPPVTVCLPFDPTLGDPELLHYEDGAWATVPTSVDQTSHVVCGEVGSFSPFAVAASADSPPTLTVPIAPITAEAASNTGRRVTFDVSATDDHDPNPTIACTDETERAVVSGALFALGTHEISCVATDATGNASAPATFAVTVQATMAGFYRPVETGGTVNRVKSEQTVAIKFNAGLLTDPARVRLSIERIDCGTRQTTGTLSDTSGKSRLRVDDGHFVFNWSTKGLAVGTCYRVTAHAVDASGNQASPRAIEARFTVTR